MSLTRAFGFDQENQTEQIQDFGYVQDGPTQLTLDFGCDLGNPTPPAIHPMEEKTLQDFGSGMFF